MQGTRRANIRINLMLPEIKVTDPFYQQRRRRTSLLIVWVYLHSSFRGGLRMYFETECVMAVQGHPRSLILAPIESAHAASLLVVNSNLGPILLCTAPALPGLTQPMQTSTQIASVTPRRRPTSVILNNSIAERLQYRRA